MNHRPLLASPVTIARRRRLMAAITVVATLAMAVTVLFAPAVDAAQRSRGFQFCGRAAEPVLHLGG
jgi:hypothetical protein